MEILDQGSWRCLQPWVAALVCFQLLVVGYFEGIGTERGIAWRAADSLAL